MDFPSEWKFRLKGRRGRGRKETAYVMFCVRIIWFREHLTSLAREIVFSVGDCVTASRGGILQRKGSSNPYGGGGTVVRGM